MTKEILKINTIEETQLMKLFASSPVIVAYLFGSVAKNEHGTLSDADLGLILDDNLSESERFNLRLKMMGKLASALRTSRVDLVVMNDAPIYLQFEIIKANRVLYCRDERARIHYEVRIVSRYLDRK